MARLAGRTAIVTGGAKGIGRHYSQALAAEGADVMIADIADGAELAEEIAAKHGRNAATSMTCDESDEDAIVAFTRSLSRAVGGDGICVNTLAPGFTLSDSVIDDNPSHVEISRQPAIQRRAIKRDGFPQDLLGALVFLASADSDFITGQTI